MSREDICVLIPTLNEVGSIESVIRDFRSLGFDNIMVIDGHSTDGTIEKARGAGAKVVLQKGSGKGMAMKEAFAMIDEPYVILIDGDGTYLPSEAHLLIDPVLSGEADHVVGNRLANVKGEALNRLNMLGNRMINGFFRTIYGVNLTDILSGYRAFTMDGVDRLDLSKPGFEIESEMTIDSVKKGLAIIDVPITYMPRAAGTKTKLNPFKDGFKIILTIFRMARIANPLFYFGVIGSLFGLAGILTGLYVVRDWMNGRIEHIPLTILTAILIIVGLQLFLMGIMGDMMASFNREVMKQIYKNRR